MAQYSGNITDRQ